MADWWASLDLDAWSITAIVVTMLATWLLAWLARKGVRRVVERVPALTEGVKVLAVRLTGYAIWLLGIGIALTFLGASIQPVLAIAVIVGVVLVLVLRGVADNFASGVVIQTRHPFALGDEIASGDVVGVVVESNARAVVLRTTDGRIVHVPNSTVLREPLFNNSVRGARRSEVEVRLTDTASADRAEVRATLASAATGAEGVHHREPITVLPVTIGPGRSVYRVQFWHHPLRGATVTAAVVDALGDALAVHGHVGVVTSDPPPPALAGPTAF
ncbi:mechanosensitive ion channel family protein [Agromyces sp. Marseille-Q5079]|uniref:mechanosensitive ion channel family protein n=1 Tax=Agromyces sp. Marseille-Q5079 TaxID=3439059 RepID=UPI003D9C909D